MEESLKFLPYYDGSDIPNAVAPVKAVVRCPQYQSTIRTGTGEVLARGMTTITAIQADLEYIRSLPEHLGPYPE